jgi:anhydro-N-acetylmuramic acid kinase
MSKSYYSLGLMSGTSMDGVDASIIQSDGENKYKVIIDKYFEYPAVIFKKLTKVRDKIKSLKDLKKFSKETKSIEKEITLFHVKAVKETLKKSRVNIDLIGFHGQTIYHNVKKKISKQLGDGRLLSKLTRKTVVYDFRKNDLKNGGRGAPLTPIFHKLLAIKFKANLPAAFINLGGIANETVIDGYSKSNYAIVSAYDIGPGMCLIDQLVRLNTYKKYDKDGKVAKSGKINKIILKKITKIFSKIKKLKKGSYDIKDFDLSTVRDVSLKDALATLTEYTANELNLSVGNTATEIIVSGGGRKNKFLINRLKNKAVGIVKLIDEYGIDGDFVESQAFAYLAVRSYLKLPISFPSTTGVKKPCTGGIISKY